LDTKSKKFNTGILLVIICALLVSGASVLVSRGIDKTTALRIKTDPTIKLTISFSDLVSNDALLDTQGFNSMVSLDLDALCRAYESGKYEEKNDPEILGELGAAGVSYYIGTPDNHFTNIPVGGDGYPANEDAYTRTKVNYIQNSNQEPDTTFEYYLSNEISQVPGIKILLSYSDESITGYANYLSETRTILKEYLGIALAMIIAVFILLVGLIIGAGRKRKSEDGARKLYAWDKVFVEIQLALLAVGVSGFTMSIWLLVDDYYEGRFTATVYVVGIATAIAILAAINIALILSITRIIRSGMLAKNSIIGRFLLVIKSGFDGSNPFAKTILLVGLEIFLLIVACVQLGYGGIYSSGVWLFLFVIIILTLVFTCQRLIKYGKLRKGINEISSGNLSYTINPPEKDHSEFAKMSRLIDEIGSAQNIALNNELKNTRMKTELISNVSHDLRTPLTSIITYTDLLKTEGLTSENAAGYLDIIDEKSRRLQKLTDDLFEAAKASSGAINVNKEKVDLLALINQGLAEINGGFEEKELQLILNAENEHYYVEADGQLLWRVVDNLLTNVRKYAQPGSRVYIDIKENDGSLARQTSLEVKNVSASQLNIEADELMERFMRGDEARTTDGSGLGLAIARDLVNLQGGYFDIVIDGDLFKAVTILKAV
jgi:signal transduction histidine kinase